MAINLFLKNTVSGAVQGEYSSIGPEMNAFAGEVDIGFVRAAPAILKHLNGGVNTTVLVQVNDMGSVRSEKICAVQRPISKEFKIEAEKALKKG